MTWELFAARVTSADTRVVIVVLPWTSLTVTHDRQMSSSAPLDTTARFVRAILQTRAGIKLCSVAGKGHGLRTGAAIVVELQRGPSRSLGRGRKLDAHRAACLARETRAAGIC